LPDQQQEFRHHAEFAADDYGTREGCVPLSVSALSPGIEDGPDFTLAACTSWHETGTRIPQVPVVAPWSSECNIRRTGQLSRQRTAAFVMPWRRL